MTLRLITVSAPDATLPRLLRLAEENGASGIRSFAEAQAEGRSTIHMLAGSETRQDLLDALHGALAAQDDWRITLLPVETTVPLPREEEEEIARTKAEGEKKIAGMTREEIWNAVWSQAKVDQTYVLFVVLSTVVAALGMIEDNVAVVVGAMVIAPLLGPNLALSVGVALGDGKLMGRALATNLVGMAVALGLSLLIGLSWPLDLTSSELMGRSDVGFDGMAIALASGAAAALSLVSGLSSTLVGVMVAVALLPPTSAMGLFLGAGEPRLALGAALLLAVNVVCVNLSAQIVFRTKGIRPRTWFEAERAKWSTRINLGVWTFLLIALAAIILLKTHIGADISEEILNQAR